MLNEKVELLISIYMFVYCICMTSPISSAVGPQSL